MVAVNCLGAPVQVAERPELVMGKAFDRSDEPDAVSAAYVESIVEPCERNAFGVEKLNLTGSRRSARRTHCGTVKVSGRAPGSSWIDEPSDGGTE